MAISSSIPSVRVEPKSQHVSDAAIQPFLQADFDPASYLNNALPPLSASNARASYGNAVPLAELSSQTQSLLSQLNAQTSRLSNTLTQLTDEIIRSGGRLAYEVEVLRGETTGLTDTLDDGLKKDIELLAPKVEASKTTTKDPQDEAGAGESGNAVAKSASTEPEYLQNLRTLSTIRERLDRVIKVFGDAMAWPIAPSEVASVASTFISVSGPEASEENRSREEKAKEYTEKLRAEVNDMLLSAKDTAGLQAAALRVEEVNDLVGVWRGTAEEKSRVKVVDGLAKMVEDRHRALSKNTTARKPGGEPARGVDMRYGNLDSRVGSEGGYGFLQNLKNLKNEMYLD